MSVIQDEPRLQNTTAVHEPDYPAPPPVRRHRSHGGALLAAAVAGVLVTGLAAESVPPGTPGHQVWTTLTRGSPLATASVATAQPQTDPTLAAIQQVIQRANDEQAQAIASQNPAVMSDTATSAHYQQLVQINQSLQAQGVTGIRLTSLGWGPITINGTTATATTFETWVTTFSDSTTTQSTDTNVYTLVQQNGSWVVQDDQHPGSTPTSQPAPGSPAQPASPAPAQPAPALTSQNTSHNWSGYAATGGQAVTGVSGTWTVPQLAPNGAPGVGATWVG